MGRFAMGRLCEAIGRHEVPIGYRISGIGYGRAAQLQFSGRRGAPTGRPEGLQFRG